MPQSLWFGVLCGAGLWCGKEATDASQPGLGLGCSSLDEGRLMLVLGALHRHLVL